MAVTKELVNQAIEQLTNVYDLKGGKIDVTDKGEYMLLTLNGSGYTIYPTDDRDVDDIVSFIAADQNLQPNKISKVKEDYDDDNDDDDDVKPNKGFSEGGAEYIWNGPIGDVCHIDFDNWQVWSANEVSSENEEIITSDNVYFVVDIDTGFIDWGPCDTAKEAQEFLNSKLDDAYDEGLDVSSDKKDDDTDLVRISSGVDTETNVAPLSEDYPTLLVALESEKDAEITYKTLLEIEKSSDKPNQQVIELLEKILKDELEHIALLSALSASKNSDFVAEDSKDQFDGYVEDITT